MADPLEVVEAEVAAEAEASVATEAAEAAAPAARSALMDALGRLLEPSPWQPEQFRGTTVAQKVNRGLETAYQAPGTAAEAEVGESVALCGKALLGSEGGNWSPLGHLAWSLLNFGYELVQRRGAAGGVNQGAEAPRGP